MWYNIFLFDIIRPKKCLCPLVFSRYGVGGWILIKVFSLFLKSFCFVPTFFHKMLKVQVGANVLFNSYYVLWGMIKLWDFFISPFRILSPLWQYLSSLLQLLFIRIKIYVYSFPFLCLSLYLNLIGWGRSSRPPPPRFTSFGRFLVTLFQTTKRTSLLSNFFLIISKKNIFNLLYLCSKLTFVEYCSCLNLWNGMEWIHDNTGFSC